MSHKPPRTPGDDPMPEVVLALAKGVEPQLVWLNELGGRTFRLGDRFVKWNPPDSRIDLNRERLRLEWISARHPAPRVIDWGTDADAQWLLTEALPGESAIGDKWVGRPTEAIGAIAAGLRALHAIPIGDFPQGWTNESWVGRHLESLPRPPVEHPVVVHGDACAPNTLITDPGQWVGNVDFGDLAVGDRWADLAIASMSLDWNYGDGHQEQFFEAYGVDPDESRIRYYRQLWHLES